MTDHSAKMITISFFQAFSPEGHGLFRDVKQALEGRTLRGLPVKLIEEREYKMMPAIRACLESDLVIFDGSVEDGENRQYYGAIELMKYLDHVLIVSRTMLPYNFEGMRKGGAPQFIMTSTTRYCYEKSNREILDWLLDVMINQNLELPRKVKPNLPESAYERNADQITQIKRRLISDSQSRMAYKAHAFVSYLSRYSREYAEGQTDVPCVETLFETIAQVSGHPGRKRLKAVPRNRQTTEAEILYFPPGKISLQLMTGQRRFEIVSVTESYIRRCNSFWIYQTDDYAASWWTYGELLSLAQIFRHDRNQCPDIYVAKPVKNARGDWDFDITGYLTPEEKESFLPQITEFQARELLRLHSNSDPNTVAYEQVNKMQKLAMLPDFLLRADFELMLAQVRSRLSVLAPEDEDQREILEELSDFEHYKESVHSYAYTKAFWENHIIECPVCKAGADTRLDPDKFMYMGPEYFYRISPRQYETIRKTLGSGPQKTVITLPCGHTVSVGQGGCYCRWWTVKGDVPTGPQGKLIEHINFVSF